jgi:hypothetical protein
MDNVQNTRHTSCKTPSSESFMAGLYILFGMMYKAWSPATQYYQEHTTDRTFYAVLHKHCILSYLQVGYHFVQ